MFLAEPKRTAYDLLFSIAGIPVRVHPFFWLVAVVLGARGDVDGPEILIWVGVLFVSILVHEFGHALTMRRYGESPRVVLYMMGGLAIADSSWGMGKSRNSNEQIIISAAGPAAGFALAAIVIGLLHLDGGKVTFAFDSFIFWNIVEWPAGIRDNFHVKLLIWDLLQVNILWGLVNLLPVYPLDGGQISREVFMQKGSDGITKSLWLSVIAGAGMALVGLLVVQKPFIGIMFGLLAYSSYQMLQQMSGGGFGGGPWGGRGGGRGW